jgi:hypothetical protein
MDGLEAEKTRKLEKPESAPPTGRGGCEWRAFQLGADHIA